MNKKEKEIHEAIGEVSINNTNKELKEKYLIVEDFYNTDCKNEQKKSIVSIVLSAMIILFTIKLTITSNNFTYLSVGMSVMMITFLMFDLRNTSRNILNYLKDEIEKDIIDIAVYKKIMNTETILNKVLYANENDIYVNDEFSIKVFDESEFYTIDELLVIYNKYNDIENTQLN